MAATVLTIGASSGCSRFDAEDSSPPATADEAVTVGTDLAALRQVLTVPGEPTVAYTSEPIGIADDRVPGPIDYHWTVVLDYHDAGAVDALTEDLEPTSATTAALPWFPDDLAATADGDTIVVAGYTGVAGFSADTEVGVVQAEPRFVVITWSTT